MVIKAHMIVTITVYDGESKHDQKILSQVQEWLKQLREMPDNLEKIGNFLYNGEDEPEHSHYDKVRFLVEIEK